MTFIRYLSGGLLLIYLALFYLTHTDRFAHTQRDFRYDPKQCTLYCEEHGCTHPSVLKRYWPLMIPSINFLKALPGTYHLANLIVYILLFPTAVYSLSYYLIRPYHCAQTV